MVVHRTSGVPSRFRSSSTVTIEPGSADPYITGVVSFVSSGLSTVGGDGAWVSSVSRAVVSALALPAASTARADIDVVTPSAIVGIVPVVGVAVAVFTDQVPFEPTVVSKVTSATPSLPTSSVSVSFDPRSAVPVIVGLAWLVYSPLVMTGASGGVVSEDLLPELPPPPPAAPTIASPPTTPSIGLNENSVSRAAAASEAVRPDAYIRNPPSGSEATGWVDGVTVSSGVPPMFSIDIEQGSCGVQRVKKPCSETLFSSARPSTTRSPSTRLTSAAGDTRPPASLRRR